MSAGAAYVRGARPNESFRLIAWVAQDLARDPYRCVVDTLRGVVGADQIL
jgi:hypothetical protein